ncbi:hypothetical protein MMJ46_08935 [Enterococcus cecorum]|uniref:hypothetical protein n=1 Tax=Enterococcus cecorum TaxID=44008 RepID=UPI001FABFED4|nr:hypothetical protein [Enterococcus cecorum]MCJ0597400.1 hypothetical protein [Enterococcus cecorum]
MKMIEVLNMMAEGNLKEGTILKFVDSCNETVSYIYDEEMNAFYDEAQYDLGSEGEICGPFLNKKVELIEPKPKKYLVKLNVKWLKSTFSHVNYVNRSTDQYVIIGDDENLGRSYFGCYQTQFTKKELQSIKPVKEFLDDMQGKYELVEVTEDNEID